MTVFSGLAAVASMGCEGLDLVTDWRTRSRKLVVLMGTLKALAIAVKNMDARRRVTLLKQRLQASLSLGSLSL